ncbi:UNVERIFIED_CONTAM: hypothetical protein FKN15_062462 [Acipenser sinensis]
MQTGFRLAKCGSVTLIFNVILQYESEAHIIPSRFSFLTLLERQGQCSAPLKKFRPVHSVVLLIFKWNRAIETMYTQCMEAGDKCIPLHYEQLVLHPEMWMKTLLKFLDVPWNEAVLHHEELIGKAGGVSLSKVERSTDQVIKPVNVEALSKWVGKIPQDVLRDMPVIAPMLAKLGYDPYANPPNYGRPDPRVLDNTRRTDSF